MSWVLQRVDDRLIHGQVVVAWGAELHPRRIWVVDDAAAASSWERELLSSAAPDVEVRVIPLAEASERLAGEAQAEGAAFLLVRDLKTALTLVESGVEVHTLNLGGIHYAPGRTKINEYVYLDPGDRDRARRLLARGVILEVQDVPAARPQALAALDPEMAGS
jgi:mannose/fructose/N-acetylgalactosamine-specific phosphotransferase system component IIB